MQRPARKRDDWRPWLAWRPVMVGTKMAWLKWIERRDVGPYASFASLPLFEYRLANA